MQLPPINSIKRWHLQQHDGFLVVMHWYKENGYSLSQQRYNVALNHNKIKL